MSKRDGYNPLKQNATKFCLFLLFSSSLHHGFYNRNPRGGGGALNTLAYGDVSPRNLQDPKNIRKNFQ